MNSPIPPRTKNILWLLLPLALASPACQQSAPPAQSQTEAPLATAKPAAAKAATPTATADTALTASMQALLQQHDLAPLWANRADGGAAAAFAMEGFYGPPHHRISFYFGNVERDLAQPNLFHVTGLDRYKKVITPFSGTITVRALRPFTKGMFLDVAEADSAAPAYTAVARFALNEDPSTKGAGNYAGEALLDFYIDSQQHLHLASSHPMSSELNPTLGSGLIFRGYHVSNQTGLRKSVAFSRDYSMVVPESLAKLGLGARSEEVNPNLAKLGWNENWENEEWWAKSPKPSFSL
jgi:hypothetical protein